MRRHEPVGEPAPGNAPIMSPDLNPPSGMHWCEEVGSRVYHPKERCPLNCQDSDDGGETGV